MRLWTPKDFIILSWSVVQLEFSPPPQVAIKDHPNRCVICFREQLSCEVVAVTTVTGSPPASGRRLRVCDLPQLNHLGRLQRAVLALERDPWSGWLLCSVGAPPWVTMMGLGCSHLAVGAGV